MVGHNQRIFEEDSDEDSINTTTTGESEGSGEYGVEKILAEDERPDGQIEYLLKWEGYPLHQSMWVTRDSITSEVLLRDWYNDKLAVRRGEKQAFDINEFYVAVESHMEEKDKKKERRLEKRRKRAERVNGLDNAKVSEDELTKPHSPKRTKAESITLQRKDIARPVTKGRAKVLTLEEDGDDEDSSNSDSRPSSRAAPVSEQQIMAKTAPVSKISKPQEKTTARGKAATLSSGAKKQPIVEEKHVGDIQPLSMAAAGSVSNPPQVSSVAAAKKSVSTTAAKSNPEKRPSASDIFNKDGAKTKPRRQSTRVSGETPKDSTHPRFTNMSIQNRYQKYGRNEPAPDPNALIIVDPKTGKTEPPRITPSKVGSTEIHSAYGRRTPPLASKAKSQSPPTRVPQAPSIVRRETAQPTMDTNSEGGRSPIEPPRSATGITLKQITCMHWQAGRCQYTADRCAYAHFYGPSVVQSKKQTTCYYWKNNGNCRFSADQCEFAHFDTGIYAGAPGTFNRRNSVAPNIADMRASDLRLATSSSSPNEVFFDAPEQLPRPPPPEGVASRENEVVSSETPAHVTITRPSESTNRPLNEMPITTLPPGAADPRLTGRTFTTETVTASSTIDPRLRPLTPKDSRSELLTMDVPKSFNYSSLDADLNMAKKYISKLDGSRLLKDKKGAIEHVYLHMSRERAGELHLLRKYFESLNCKVFSSHSGTGHWDFFRRTFEKPPCLLIFHPSELFTDTIPGLHHYLLEKGAKVRVFSIGVQHQQCIREQREPAYEAQRLFPHGGITFITDDILAYYPDKATEIINKFLKDAKEKPPGGQLSKIGARPGVKDWMARLAGKKFEEQGGEGECTDLRWIQCYEALCRLCPVEDEDPDFPDHSVPLETSHLWSVWEESLPSFKGRWESGDEEGATDYMANHFAGEACDKAWKYRKFFFVYQRPGMEQETTNSQGVEVVKQDVDPKRWMKKYCHIGVVTPDQALKSM